MTDPQPPTPASPVSHAEFVSLETVAELRAIYAQRGAALDDATWLARAQQDWYQVALAEAKQVTESPSDLPAVVAEVDGITYRIYGVYHGMAGGSDAGYKEFVDRRAKTLELTLFENGIHHFYPKKKYAVIPDFAVLGVWGSIGIGLYVGRLFPLLVKEGLQDLLRRGGGIPADSFDYSALYHGIDPETRRGLDPEDPVLPSRLQIDEELGRWQRYGSFGRLLDPFSIVPRSLYMAGFARGYASSRGLAEVDLIVGDLHTMEIVRALETPALREHPVFRGAEAFGRRSGAGYTLAFLASKLLHLSLAAATGCSILLPALLGVYMLVMWMLGYDLRWPWEP